MSKIKVKMAQIKIRKISNHGISVSQNDSWFILPIKAPNHRENTNILSEKQVFFNTFGTAFQIGAKETK